MVFFEIDDQASKYVSIHSHRLVSHALKSLSSMPLGLGADLKHELNITLI